LEFSFGSDDRNALSPDLDQQCTDTARFLSAVPKISSTFGLLDRIDRTMIYRSLVKRPVTLARLRMHHWWLLLAVVAAATTLAQANLVSSPYLGCLEGGIVDYALLDSPPIAHVVHGKEDSVAPLGAGCFAKTDSAATWVTVSAMVRAAKNTNTLIGEFGAISELPTVRYWSTTDQKWRPLVSSAWAIGAAKSGQPRADYSPAELTAGNDQYYVIADSRSKRTTTFRLRILEVHRSRVVVETSNVDPIKQWGITLYGANALDTFYFLEERARGVWAYYSITRVVPASFLVGERDKSYINRAVALYRHYMRLPTDAEPPPAP
jgi:hypothetical protein